MEAHNLSNPSTVQLDSLHTPTANAESKTVRRARSTVDFGPPRSQGRRESQRRFFTRFPTKKPPTACPQMATAPNVTSSRLESAGLLSGSQPDVAVAEAEFVSVAVSVAEAAAEFMAGCLLVRHTKLADAEARRSSTTARSSASSSHVTLPRRFPNVKGAEGARESCAQGVSVSLRPSGRRQSVEVGCL